MRYDKQLLGLVVGVAALGPVPAPGQCGPSGCYVRPVTPPQQQQSVPSAVQSVLPCVVRIVHRDASGVSLGSGTLIATRDGASFILTCAHLFEGTGRTEVRLARRTYAARLIAIDKQHDLALLQTRPTDAAPAVVETAEPGGLLVACGYGPNGDRSCISGPITGYSTAAGAQAPSLRLRGTVRSGDSGGPVFNTAGRLVAVIWGQRGGETYAMGGAPLRRILSRLPGTPRRASPIPRREPPGRDLIASMPELPKDLARQDDLLRLESSWQRRFDRLSNQVNVNLSTPAPASPLTRQTGLLRYAEPLLTALAVGGPLGVGLFVGRSWLRSRAKARVRERLGPSKPVAVDSPPPPQQVMPETHYVSYERDEFAKAHQWACEQLARKFPGAVEMLASLDSLIKQQLNGGAGR